MSSKTANCTADLSTDIELGIEFAIAVPSMLLYFLVIWTYLRSPALTTSYYLLFLVHSIINIVYFLSRAFIMRVSSLSPLCQWVLNNYGVRFDYTFTWLYFTYHYMQHAQALSIISLNLNRVLHIYCYLQFTLLKQSTYVLIALIVVIPFGLTWHLLVSPVKFITSAKMLGMDYERRFPNYPGLSALHLGMDCTAAGIVIITDVLIIARMKRVMSRKKSSEFSLTIVSMFISIGLLASAIIQYLIASVDRSSATYYAVLNYRWIVTDFMSLFPPYSLLLLSSTVRHEVVRLLMCRKWTQLANPGGSQGPVTRTAPATSFYLRGRARSTNTVITTA